MTLSRVGKKYITKYRHAVIATDAAIFTVRNAELYVLLIEMKKKPYGGYWALPGGLVSSRESVDEAVRRILFEKGGIQGVYLEQLYTFGKIDRDPFGRVVSVAYYALVPPERVAPKTTSEYGGIRWLPVKKLPKLAYDHDEIIATALQRLRGKVVYTNIVYGLLPKEFTLSELQRMYEIILGKNLDKRNFRKKFLSLGLIEPLRKETFGKAHRPAQLYAFVKRVPQMIEIL